jgi:HEAT repeat protein/O6-methylguanine-DNA--protein-cysteine methyltransferase
MAAIGGLRQVLQQRSTWRTEMLPGDFDMAGALADAQRALLHAAADSQELVRVEAAGPLGLFATPEAAQALVDLALGDASDAVQEVAAGALANSSLPHISRLLASALEHSDQRRRARAVAVLGISGGPGAGRLLMEALRDPAPEVRTSALSTLSRSQVAVPLDNLVSELRNADSQVRAAMAARLGRERAPESVQALAQALGDPEEDVRVSAVGALAGMGRLARKHEGAITARLTDPGSRVREAAASTLKTLREAWMEAPETAQLLRRGPLSAEAAASLLEMAVGGDMGSLLRSLDDPEAAQSVVTYLANAGRGKLNPLLSALRQTDERDQARILPALSEALRKTGSAEDYLAELKALDPGVRLMAVEVAGLLGTPDAVTALVEALARDPLPEVRSRAASMLAGAPGDAVRAALLRAQEEDPNEVVRLVAARALGRARPAPEGVTLSSPAEETPSLDSVQGSAR